MKNYTSLMRNQRGNVFFAIFGAVALVGVLTAGVATFVKGPLATSVKITRQNTAENQMSIAGQVAVMAAANAPGGGDCDGDSFVESIEWREDLTKPFPVGGGLIPMSIGISKKDPWGTEYGYCVWDHGALHNGAGSCGGSTQKRLEGTDSKIYPVVALVSAGPDKTFTTTCRDFVDADVNGDGDLEDDGVDLPLVGKANSSDDDVIFTYTYEEATGASGGLWSLKSGDPGTAVIDKKIESTGVGSFAGGVLLPDSSLITCDPTTAGIMAKNASGNGIQICDGTGWQEISGSGSAAGSGLVLEPNVSTGMNVNGTCGTATCYSSNVVFKLTNKLVPAATSSVIAVSLTNTLNFEKVSDNCNGNTLATGTACQIVVRAKASGNISYAGELQITANNSPFAMLDGVASSFPGCNAGGNAPGGYYLACGLGGHNLIITPGGCSATPTNPTCNGGNDTLVRSASTGEVGKLTSAGMSGGNGQQNTATMMAYSGGAMTFPAANWCHELVYQGFDDWFLPSQSEMQNYYYPNRVAVGYTAATEYSSSTPQEFYDTGNNYWMYLAINGSWQYTHGSSPKTVRCMRWDPVRAVTPVVDTTPITMNFSPSYGGVSQPRTSNSATVYGVTTPVAISVSGGISPQYSINGGAYTSAAGTVNNGDQVTLRATSPIAGQESVVAVNVGSSSFNWQVRTPGNNVIRVFTTSTTTTGALGGAGGADTFCTNRANAVGLPGSWVAIVGSGAHSASSIDSRLPWNWITLKNMNGVGATVATSLADFLDGSISAPMNYSESGVPVGSIVWTGLFANGLNASNCQSWTVDATTNDAFGDSSAVSAGGYFLVSRGNCGTAYRLMCMESNQAGADLDPDTVNIGPAVVYSSGAIGQSRSVTLTGITDEITVTLNPSAGSGNIIKNGVPVNALTTTAGLNETLIFTLTAPAVLGTKNTATIALGPDNYDWWVGYADSAKTARAFTAYKSGGNHGGLTGADTICSNAAANSPYGLSGGWKAILSDSTTHAANRIPWNWGTLKTVTGTTIVDNGYVDLLDGSLDSSIGIDQNGNAVNNNVWTGSNRYGMSYTMGTQSPAGWCNNWTNDSNYGGGMVNGFSSNIGPGWLENGNTWCGNDSASGKYIYCIENVDDTSDTTPNNIYLAYPVQVTTGSRHTSALVTISGMSQGVTQSINISGASGTPRVKINGGAEVTSGTIKNGDTVQFLLDAPATANSSNRMTITSGGMTSYWRVWTGDTTNSITKRIFVGWSVSVSSGITSYDTACNSNATSAGLGGSWKAVISGVNEPDYAVNRIGYNWSTLNRVDGTTVSLAGNLWSTTTIPLLTPVALRANGATISVTNLVSNTTSTGLAKSSTASTTYGGSCNNWLTNGVGWTASDGTTGTTSNAWIDDASPDGNNCYYCCGGGQYFYCIEQ